jgi:hypothetical protein
VQAVIDLLHGCEHSDRPSSALILCLGLNGCDRYFESPHTLQSTCDSSDSPVNYSKLPTA